MFRRLTSNRAQLSIWAIAATVILVAVAGVWLGPTAVGRDRQARESKVVLQRPTPATATETTMLEAWDVAAATLPAWGRGWRLASINSTDVHDSPGPDSGNDGRRRTWQAEAVGPEGAIRWLRITSGVPVDALEPGTTAASGGALPRPILDSPGAARLAIDARPGLAGGVDKARGWHFAYSRDATGNPELVVLGSYNLESARLIIDQAQRRVTKAERLVLAGGGLLVSRDSGRTWEASQLSGVTLAVGADRGRGEEAPAYAAVYSGDGLGIWRSADQGRSWARITSLPRDAGPAAYDLVVTPLRGAERILVSTFGGLWSFDLSTGELQRETAPARITDLQLDGNGLLHAVVVEAPGQAQHFAYDPGTGWLKQGPRGVRRLSTGFLVRELGDGIDLGFGEVLDLATGGSGLMLAAGRESIMKSSDGGGTWRSVRAGNPASIALSTRFDTDGTAVATLFPDIVVLTTDWGESWRTVSTLPNSRHAGRVAFMSSSTVLIQLGGSFTWREF